MDEYKVDFHVHTSYSDGRAKPMDILKRAKELEYDMISITDHDGIDGIKEALIAGEALEIKVIPGVELATVTKDGVELHILGYYFDPDHPRLNEVLEDLKAKRNDRNERLVAVLNEMGYDLNMDDLRKVQPNNYIGKPVIARALVQKGYINNPKEAFEPGKFLESPEAKAVKKDKLQTEDAIALIKEAGGIAVLAHPIQIKGIGERGSEEFYSNLDKILRPLKKKGLGGLECYHPDQNEEQSMKFITFAEKYHLHITRGSDFHGENFE